MKRKEIIAIISIFVLAIICRIVFFWQIKSTPVLGIFQGSDSLNYIQWAKSIAQEGVFYKTVFYGMPLYAYFLAFILKLSFMNFLNKISQHLFGNIEI